MALSQPSGQQGVQQYPHQRQHHVHLPHHFHRRDKEKEKDKEDRQCAAVTDTGAQTGLELYERDKGAAIDGIGSRTPSRRPSLDQLSIPVHERGPVLPGLVKQEREKSLLRASELNKSLLELSTLANTSTRRLDNSYYAVLEKLGALQDNIASLKDLALKSRRVDEHFSTETGELAEVINSQLNEFGNFQTQEDKISGLQDRIKTGRQTVEVLGSRLDMIQDRVEQWSKLDTRRQRTVQQRLKVLWSVAAVTSIVIFLILTIGYPFGSAGRSGSVQRPDALKEDHGHPVMRDGSVNNSASVKGIGNNAMQVPKDGREKNLGDDPRLRAFDEL